MSPTEVAAGRLRYKDLCLDAVDAGVAARFWSSALGLTAEQRGELYRLHDDDPSHTLWVNPVPEPRTVKQRVHLDLLVPTVEDLVELGAAVTQELPRWTLMRDPEGGELCAFVRPPDELPRYRLYELVVDTADSERIATWWADLFGVEVQRDPDEDFCWLEGVPGMPWELVFQPVPEPKQVKNRVHWDVSGDSADALAADARLVRARDDEIGWDVLADPDGNEFCVFPARARSSPLDPVFLLRSRTKSVSARSVVQTGPGLSLTDARGAVRSRPLEPSRPCLPPSLADEKRVRSFSRPNRARALADRRSRGGPLAPARALETLSSSFARGRKACPLVQSSQQGPGSR